jgi:hypothetical protein
MLHKEAVTGAKPMPFNAPGGTPYAANSVTIKPPAPHPPPIPTAAPVRAMPPRIPTNVASGASTSGAAKSGPAASLVAHLKRNPYRYAGLALTAGGLSTAALGGILGTGVAHKGKGRFSGTQGISDADPEMAEVLTGAAGGGALTGLGSVLYGKLKDKPNLQRDLILTLIGATAGAGYTMNKQGSPTLMTIATIATILAATAGGIGHSEYSRRQSNKLRKKELAAHIGIQQQGLEEAARSRKAMTYGTVGALGGGATGGTLSNLYGKKTGRESLRRDIMSALAGAGLGGAAGLATAAKV